MTKIPFNFSYWRCHGQPQVINGKGEKMSVVFKMRYQCTYPVGAINAATEIAKTYTEFGRYIEYHPSEEDLFMLIEENKDEQV